MPKRIIFLTLLVCLSLGGCRMNNEDLAAEVLRSMKVAFVENQKFIEHSLTVDDLTVVNVKDNQYQGIATIEHLSKKHRVRVDITYDGTTYVWEIEGEDLAFIAESEFDSAYREAANLVIGHDPSQSLQAAIDRSMWLIQVASMSDAKKASELADALGTAISYP